MALSITSTASEYLLRRILAPGLCLLHLVLHLIFSAYGWIHFYDLFLWLLFLSNALVAAWLYSGQGNVWVGLGFILIVASHGLIGYSMAPTALTSAAMLLGNLLTMYVGWKLFQNQLRLQLALFVVSYLLLYYIFVWYLQNAEALFLLALLGLVGTARYLKLLSYFWALVVAFTLAQPYAWETAVILIFILKILYSVRTSAPSLAANIFLGLGLLWLFSVLFPVAVIMLGESPHNLFKLLQDQDILQSISLTLFTATCATGLLVVFTLPLAYALARLDFFGKTLLLSLIDIPIVIPQSVAGIALLKVFGKSQIIGGFLFEVFGLRIDGTVLGIILAQIFVAFPFFMKSALAAYEAVPIKYEWASRTLGANSFQTFYQIALPLAWRGLFLGAVLAWARAAGEFGAVFFIAAYPETAPIAVYTRFMSLGLSEVAPLVSALLLFSLGMFFLLQWAARLIPAITNQEPKT